MSIKNKNAVLSDEQEFALNDALAGHNMYLTGGGGVGKSFLIERIVSGLRAQGREVSICSSTGISAVNIGGMTIHRLLGTGYVGNVRGLKSVVYTYTFRNARDRLRNVDTIIVDEVSMLSGDYLDMMDSVLRTSRTNMDAPFGGCQIIFVGDILQLPPVIKEDCKNAYMYMSDAWKSSNMRVHYLTKIYRQSDEELQRNLSYIRTNKNLTSALDYFNCRVGKGMDEDSTRLFSLNSSSLKYNLDKLDAMPGEMHGYNADYVGDDANIEKLKKSCIADDPLLLKDGAHVLFLRNDSKSGIYNGMRGKVTICEATFVSVMASSGYTVDLEGANWEYCDTSGKVLAKMNQIPVKLAFSISIHKSQGMTLESLVFDPVGIFAPGQVYVALSRVRSYEGLGISSPILSEHVKVDDCLVCFDNTCLEQSKEIRGF